MLISVIITTKNEEKRLEDCLKSVLGQTFPAKNLEIIVVDNDSADRTKEIARRYTEKVFDRGPERSAQRNFGAQKATGNYIFYLDADMTLSKNVISECAEKMENDQNIAGLYIPEIITGKKFWNQVRNFERGLYNGTVVDAVRFVRGDKFLEVGGFDDRLTGPEDWDFDKKIRGVGKVDIIKNPLFHDETGFNLRKYLEKKIYYARDFEKYVVKWGKKDPDVRKQFGFYYRYIGVFVENGKWKKLLRHPILASGMYFLRFLVGVKYIIR